MGGEDVAGTRLCKVQDRMARDTEAAIREAGFGRVEVERFSMGPGVNPVSPGISGVEVA